MCHNRITIWAMVGTAIVFSLPCVLGDTCGVNFRTGYVGYITSPNYPSPYPDNQNCDWTIDVPFGDVIRLTFYPPFNTERTFDKLKIIEIYPSGQRVQTRLLDGKGVPPVYTSENNRLELKFESDGSNTAEGFGLFWGRVAKTDVCGGAFGADTAGGYITSPNYPSAYDNNQNCTWTIDVAGDNFIRLIFLAPFDLGTGDTIQIFDGENQIITATGDASPSVYTSKTNSLRVEFKTNESGAKAGFSLVWEKLSHSCSDHTLRGSQGEISTAGFQNRYLGPECSWNILVNYGRYIDLEFNWASVSNSSFTGDDWVEVFDVTGNDSTILRGRWPKSDFKVKIRSFGPKMAIKIHSMNDLSGFQANWQAVNSCGRQTLAAKEGYVMSYNFEGISSPDYNLLSSGLVCTWDIITPPHIDVHLSIWHLWGCQNDTHIFEILEYSPNQGRYVSLQDWCQGNGTTTQITSSSQQLRLVYHQERDDPTGLFASWKSVCGKTLTSLQGSLNTPNYPRDYYADLECRWEIRVPTNHVTELHFNKTFDVIDDAMDGCPNDYVEIYETNDENNTISRGRFCGSDSPPAVTFLTSTITVVFHSDANNNGQGFSLSWSSAPVDICRGTSHAGEEGGYITSPNYPALYGNNQRCDWFLNTTEDNVFTLRFYPPFQLEPNSDVLEIAEGGSYGGRRRYLTGNSVPPTFTTEASNVRLTFTSNGANVRKGFGVFWEEVARADLCGGSVGSGDGGYITSHNYPSAYDNNQRCNWTITVPSGDFIRLTFNPLFQLEQNFDTLKIYEVQPSGNKRLVRSLSGSTAPSVFTSGTNVLNVNFATDGGDVYSGFGFFWEKIAPGSICGGQFNTSITGGYITSPNYPYPSGITYNCHWVIHVANGYFLRLTFNPSFHLENNALRVTDYSGGTNGGSTLFSGNTVPPTYVSGGDRVELLFTSNNPSAEKGFALFWETVAQSEVCGGNLQGVDAGGYITSPNYPHPYGNFMRCDWTLTVNANNLIRLTFNHPSVLEQNYDYLKIFEIQPSGGRVLKRSFDRSFPAVFTSETNKLELEFTTDLSVINVGFSLLWEAVAPADVCGGSGSSFTGTGGYISSPNYPSAYGVNQQCNWTVTVSNDDVIRLIFNPLFRLEKNNDFILISEIDPSGNHEQVLKLTGNTVPPIYTSQNNRLELQFVSDGSTVSRGFGVFWENVDKLCNHTMRGSSGTISTDGYQDNYVGPECWWYIVAPLQQFVHLNFNWTLEKGAETDGPFHQDWLEVYDVMGGNYLTRRGQWFRSGNPISLQSFGPTLAIKLHSEDVMANFNAEWEAVSACSWNLTAKDGYITSYEYFHLSPKPVIRGQECTWDVAIPLNLSIQLDFDNYSYTIRSQGCQVLQILEYSDKDEDFIQNDDWCNHRKSKFTTSSQLMRFVYHPTRDSGEDSGFFVSWKSTCGGSFYEKNGTLSSPNYGLQYPVNLDCEWTIQGTKDHVIHLTFESPFDLESPSHSNCSFDYVEVLESTPTGALVGNRRFCGTKTPPMIVSVSNTIVVRFHSDHEKTGAGFSAMWDTACGDVFRAAKGNLTSPHFPMLYPENFDCRWEINVPEGYIVQLSFPGTFQVEGNSNCDTDYLEIYDSDTSGIMVKKGRWCGNNPPPMQSSRTSSMLLVFHSDGEKNYKGFQATWDSVCGDVYHSPTGSFTSPGFPKHYPANLNCRWEMHVAEGQRVLLEFGPTFDIEMDRHGCGYDDIEILDSLSNGTMISNGRLCSVRKPPVFVSTSSQLQVVFKSDGDKSGQGFTASWSSVSGCGQSYSSMSGYLLSPNFPKNYPESVLCQWIIAPPRGANNTLSLSFDELFDIELSNGCSWDYLQIKLGNLVLGTWCGNTAPPVIAIRDGQQLELIFKSDKSNTGKGFFASWTAGN